MSIAGMRAGHIIYAVDDLEKAIVSFFGGKAMVDRILLAETAEAGSAVLCIEKDEGDLDKEIAFLEKHGKKGNYLKRAKRKDPKGIVYRWKLFLPFDLNLPFLMSYYNIDPKPKNFVHPNGVRRVKKLKLITNRECVEILEELIDDETIELSEGDKHAEVVYVEFD